MPQTSDTPISDIGLVGIEDSQDGRSVGGLIGAFANAEYEQGLGTLNNCVNEAMARLAKLDFVTACKITR